MGSYSKSGLKLTDAELNSAFEGSWGTEFPPILSVEQAGELAQVSAKTVYDWSHRGLLLHCARRKGKRLRIYRDRFVKFLFEDKERS